MNWFGPLTFLNIKEIYDYSLKNELSVFRNLAIPAHFDGNKKFIS